VPEGAAPRRRRAQAANASVQHLAIVWIEFRE
jgi:hypothetical protein